MNLNKSFQKIFGTDMNLVGDIEPTVLPPKPAPSTLPIMYELGEVREYHGDSAEQKREYIAIAKKRRLEQEAKA